ncbi:Alkylglycerol Monooxygenase [Manis pentadactyla]|nr:Alkylglycerol Monooxygenase [Manis pentadactyla]
MAPHTGRPEENTPGWDPRELRTGLSGQSPGQEDPGHLSDYAQKDLRAAGWGTGDGSQGEPRSC